MSKYLSKTEINSFAGNVVCLKLISDSDITKADIKWETDSDILRILTFSAKANLDEKVGYSHIIPLTK